MDAQNRGVITERKTCCLKKENSSINAGVDVKAQSKVVVQGRETLSFSLSLYLCWQIIPVWCC